MTGSPLKHSAGGHDLLNIAERSGPFETVRDAATLEQHDLLEEPAQRARSQSPPGRVGDLRAAALASGDAGSAVGLVARSAAALEGTRELVEQRGGLAVTGIVKAPAVEEPALA